MISVVCLQFLLLGQISTAAASLWPNTPYAFGSSFGIIGNATFDYVVVGGGNAGLAVASRLAEDHNVTVAVVEAGSFYEIGNGNHSQVPGYVRYFTGKNLNDTNPLVDWGFKTTPQEATFNTSVHYARGKGFGGSSARNYLGYHRGTVNSYAEWAAIVNDSSYTWDAFLPYFKKSVNFTTPDMTARMENTTPKYDIDVMGNEGPVHLTFPNHSGAFGTWYAQGLEEQGLKALDGVCSGDLDGYGWVPITVDPQTMLRESSETAYLLPALSRSTNLKLYHSSLVKRVVFNENKQAVGVAVDTQGLEYILSATKEVILSAGAFQSPQLLMVSGVGPAEVLEPLGIEVVANRSGVGHNLRDHPLFGVSHRVSVETSSTISENLMEAIEQFNKNTTGWLTNPGSDVFAWGKIPKTFRNFSNTVAASLSSVPNDWPEVELIGSNGYYGYQWDRTNGAPRDGYNYASIGIVLTASLSRGTVSISSPNAADPPVIDPAWLMHPADQAVAIAAVKWVRQIWNSTALRTISIGDEYFPGLDTQTDIEIYNWIRQSVGPLFHAACTCAMGRSDDEAAVVDSKARVIGVQRLRVVDASAFPILPPGQPVSTIYALAEKISQDIKSSY